MGFGVNKDLKVILHPYIFVLKEGQEISNDFLDYSLLMLQVSCPETIKSPSTHKPLRNLLISEFDLIGQGFSEQLLKK
jgi:hypothetical protein